MTDPRLVGRGGGLARQERTIRDVLADYSWAKKQDFRWWWATATFLLDRLDESRIEAADRAARASDGGR